MPSVYEWMWMMPSSVEVLWVIRRLEKCFRNTEHLPFTGIFKVFPIKQTFAWKDPNVFLRAPYFGLQKPKKPFSESGFPSQKNINQILPALNVFPDISVLSTSLSFCQSNNNMFQEVSICKRTPQCHQIPHTISLTCLSLIYIILYFFIYIHLFVYIVHD